MPKLYGMEVSEEVYRLNQAPPPAHPKRRLNPPAATEALRQMKAAQRKKLENAFADKWHQLGGPPLVAGYQFHDTRKWEFDFAHLAARVAIEIEGGTRSNGRHSRHEGYRGDCEKYNAAQFMNWQVYRLTNDMLTPEFIEPIIAKIRSR